MTKGPSEKLERALATPDLLHDVEITASAYAAMAAFRFAMRRFYAFSEENAQEVGLTAQQHQALLAIKAHDGAEPMSISELADSLLIKNHSAVGLVARLMDRGLITRESSALDKRRVVLRITSTAETLVKTVTRKNLRELNRSAPAIRDLLATLKKVDQTATD